MNPNLAQTLDPKLKEAYDRVMGTQINSQPQSPKPAETQVPTPMGEINSQPVQRAGKEDSKTEMVNINTSASNPQPAVTAKKGKIKPVIFIVAGVFFFLIYTFIWLKVFSVI